MASKTTSLAAMGVGAYGASVAFSMASNPATPRRVPATTQNLRGNAAVQNGRASAGLTVAGAMVAVGTLQASKRANRRSIQARAVAVEEEELLFQPGEQVTLAGPPAMAGKQGTIVAPALGDAFSVRFDSGSVFSIDIHNIQGSGVAAPAATASYSAPSATSSYSAPATVAAPAASGDDEELLFQPGERVTLTGPSALAGKQGTVISPALGDAFAIQFDSGSVFNIEIHNIQGSGVAAPAATSSYSAPAAVAAPAASGEEDEDLFQPGERVLILSPPAIAGKLGTVVGPAPDDAFAVRFDSGSVFNISVRFLTTPAGALAAAPAAAAAALVAVAPATTNSEEEFQPGQKVQVLAPPAMAGKRGEVIETALDDAFAVRFESGSVFNIATQNLQALSMAMA